MQTLSKTELIAILDIIDQCLQADTDQHLTQTISHLSNLLPAEHIILVSPQHDAKQQPIGIKEINVSYPLKWISLYQAKNFFEIDPIIKAAKENTGLLFWDHVYDKLPPPQDFKAEAANHGLSRGFSNVFNTKKDWSLISIAGAKLQDDARTKAIINRVTPHFHQALSALSMPAPPSNPLPQLTNRELEVLKWVMEGKSNWEISVILTISQDGVKFHISNIIKKLGATNRTHAAAIAARLGLIGF